MKTILNQIALILLVALCGLTTGCNNDHEEWIDGDPTLQHVYYYCFEKWGSIPGGNDVEYNVTHGETVAIPTQFMSAYERPYNPVVYYYTVPETQDKALQNGIDYAVVDAAGNPLQPNEVGAYEMVWPQAKKGVQNIYIKALNGKKGSIRLFTFDPQKKMDVTDVNTTTIIKTEEYEVRAISENYFVTLNIQ